jgi:hypothetical protein
VAEPIVPAAHVIALRRLEGHHAAVYGLLLRYPRGRGDLLHHDGGDHVSVEFAALVLLGSDLHDTIPRARFEIEAYALEAAVLAVVVGAEVVELLALLGHVLPDKSDQ